MFKKSRFLVLLLICLFFPFVSSKALTKDDYTYRETLEFDYTGSAQQYTLYYDSYLEIEVWGAEGGGSRLSGNTNSGPGGLGGYSKGSVMLPKGTDLFVYVGGYGQTAGGRIAQGGFNGGGSAFGGSDGEPGSGGGGATDIRLYTDSLYNRVIVAGGGGGGGEDGGDSVGAGGGVNGLAGGGGSYGGTQTTATGGAAFGIGASTNHDGGAGGGGWYGGGTVGGFQGTPTTSNGSDAQGGSGGSGYVWTNATALSAPTEFALTSNEYLLDAATYAGNTAFPSVSGGTETGHMGNGYVRIKLHQLCEGDSSMYKFIVNNGEQEIHAEKGVYQYTINVDKDQTQIHFEPIASEGCSTLSGMVDGDYEITAGVNKFQIISVSTTGETSIYKINVVREVSDETRLDGILLDGVEIEGFDPELFSYTIDYPYNKDSVVISANKKNKFQQVTNLEEKRLDDNTTVVNVVVTAENGSASHTYQLTFNRARSTKLKSIDTTYLRFSSAFNPELYSYDILRIGRISTSLLIAEAYDDDATITVSGDLENTGVAYITVTNGDLEPTTYTFTVTDYFTYEADGTVKKFVAPLTGRYLLYAWGAQGGTRSTAAIGGLGGFSTGAIELNKGDEIYIYVGTSGNTAGQAGGFNGGGSRQNGLPGGGGATDFRTIEGDLYTRFLVAGGGGSVGAPNKPGGAGGGTTGVSRTESYGNGGVGGTQTSAGGNWGTFGQGGNGVAASNGYGGAGGGGWYGGGGVQPDGSGDDDRGGGGGSGFILTESTFSTVPAGYKLDSKYFLTDATTISGTASMPTHDLTTSMTGNAGDGFAIIKIDQIYSSDNTLSNITINGGEIPLEFSSDIYEYTVNLEPDQSRLTIDATPNDEFASVFLENYGKYDVPSGNSDYIIEVTAPNGDIQNYVIHFTREKSSYRYLEDLQINGETIEGFEPTKQNYVVRVPYYTVDDIVVEGIKARPEQIVVGNDTVSIEGGSISLLIQVYSEDESQNTIYTVTIIPDNSSKLKVLQIGEMLLQPEFYREQYTYKVQLTENPRDAIYNIVPYDSDATYTIEGDLASGDNIITITVSEPYSEDTIYTIQSSGEFNFEGTNSYQVWTAPVSGIYQLEAWGAQGGYRTNINMGGKGAYAEGEVTLVAGTKLYLYVGTSGNNGSFNGGGTRTNNLPGGGGASDIRLAIDDLYSRLIVAAGGGSDGAPSRAGGYAGSTQGETRTQSYGSGGSGASQTAGGTYNGAFGIGGNGISQSNGYGGAGGGGWYGGGGVTPDGSADDDRGGGGGSSFVFTDPTSEILPEGYNVSERYLLRDTSMFAGNEAMPTHDGLSTMTGNTGNGYIKITLIRAHSMDSTLSNLTVDKGTMNQSFNPKVTEYTITLGSEDYRVNIDATVNAETSFIREGDLGTFDILANSDRREILVTAEDGTTTIYGLNFVRKPSSHSYLSDIKINGESLEDFKVDQFNYNVNLSFDVENEVLIEGIYGRPSQNITGDGIIDVTSGKVTVNIQVVSEDGTNVSTYILNLTKTASTKLKTLVGGQYQEFTTSPTFDPLVYEYDMDVLPTTITLPITAIPYDSNAKVSIKGNGYLKRDAVVIVTVTNPGCEDTVYTINVQKPSEIANAEVDFSYTGGVQEFTARYKGSYKIELWGAQGGYRSQIAHGGKGGYASGIIDLNAGETLYVYVGGSGNTGGQNGGWNGGGYRTNNLPGGGGATDIRTINAAWNDPTGLLSRIIVAGGGGSDGAPSRAGGYGGGLTGETRTQSYGSGGAGGTQTAAGSHYASFGVGGYGVYFKNGYGGAGGGGWYGGGGVYPDHSVDDDRGGGGGSGFVYNETATLPTGYNVSEEYLLTETSLIAGNASMPNPNGGYTTGRIGDGYARFTYLVSPSENNFLDRIEMSTVKFTGDTYSEDTFDIYVDTETTEVEIRGYVADDTATLIGNGKYDIPAGTTTVELIVTAENGNVKTYTLNFIREASDTTTIDDIVISGLVPSLCALNDAYCIYEFKVENKDYNVTVPSRIKQIRFDVVKSHKYQTIELQDYYTLEGGDNVIEIVVQSESGAKTETYKYTIKRDMTGNTDLSTLNISNPDIELNYDPSITEYYATLPNEYTSIDLTAITDDPLANVNLANVTENVIFNPDTNTYTITNIELGMNEYHLEVTAANGEEKTYFVYLWREKSYNNFIRELSIVDITSGHEEAMLEFTPTYNKLLTNYTLSVPNEINKVRIDTILDDITATIDMEEYYELNTGVNNISLTVTAQDESVNVYNIVITRAKNDNTDLAHLSIDNYAFEETFDKDTLIYHTSVPSNVSEVYVDAIAAVPSTSTVTISGNTNLKGGENIINVKVTSELGTSKTYQIIVDKALSEDNLLSSLSINNCISDNSTMCVLNPTFDPLNNIYNVLVPNNISSINISSTLNDSRSTVTGNGNYQLQVGDNTIEIIVTSESGVSNTYQIIVNREPNSNAYLTSITNNKGVNLNPTFDRETYSYTITVPKETLNITLTGTPQASTTTVIGNGMYELKVGDNPVQFITTAEDGTTLTYNVNVIRDLSVINTLDSLVVEEGLLTPTFNSNVNNYTVTVINEFEDVTVNAVPTSSDATVNIIKPTRLIVGNNTITVEVIPEKGEEYKNVYTITVIRQPEVNTYLQYINLSTGTLNPTFDKTEHFYNVDVDVTTETIDIMAECETDTSTVVGVGTKTLNYGVNTFYLTVTSFSGSTRTYTININRPEPNTALLDSLTTSVSSLNPTFNSNIFEYEILVDESVTSLVLSGTTASGNLVDGLGTVLITSDETINNIVVTNEVGHVSVYKITIKYDKSDSTKIKNLIVKNSPLQPDFDSDTNTYSVEVQNDVNALDMIITLESENATYDVIGNENFIPGNNTVTILVTNGTNTNTYTINVTKQDNDEYSAKLDSLTVSSGTLIPSFDGDNNYYEVNVPYEIDNIEISATPFEPTSTVTGYGAYHLEPGKNTIYITVTTQNGNTRVYTVVVNRKNSDPKLNSLTSNVGQLLPIFDSLKTEYTLVVEEGTTNFTLSGTYNNDLNVIGLQEYTFVEGGKVNVVVTNVDGDATIYEINLTSDTEALNSSLIQSLVAHEGQLNPSFTSDAYEYLIKVPNDIVKLTLDVDLVSPNATYEVVGNGNFVVGSNIVRIVVTNGESTTTYTLNVIRQEPASRSTYLSSLTVNQGSLNPAFNKTKMYYTVEVENGITNIKIDATAEDSEASVTGTGLHTLVIGNNILPVKVLGADGVERVYQVVVNRKASNNTNLSRLTLEDVILSPSFNKDVTNYQTQTFDNELTFIEVMTEDPNATYEILNNNLVNGNNRVIVRVTAADLVTTKDYVINVTKNASNNNNLESLVIENVVISPEFNKAITLYNASVDSNMNQINIIATPEDSNATVTGIGAISIVPGQNILEVIVTSESGNEKIYTIVLDKALSTNNYLSYITLSTGVLNPTFDKLTNDYTVSVDYNVDTITIDATKEDSSASLDGVGTYDLVVGDNSINLIVTAEDGSVNTYVINVNRSRYIGPNLSKLEINHYLLSPEFNEETISYTINVDNEITSLPIELIETKDSEATYEVIDNENLIVGINVVSINVIGSDGSTKTYTILVNRLPVANNYLAYIDLSNGTLDPIFNKLTLDYDVVVPNDVESITISGEPEVESSTATGFGTYSLNVGENKITISVTSSTGITRHYYIYVYRELSSENKLADLTVKSGNRTLTLNPEFNSNINNYTLEDLTEDVTSLVVSATPIDDTATVEGVGTVNIVGGENVINIKVTSQNGDENIYTITVTRPLSNNNYLTDLIPSIGTLEPSFDYYGTEYTLNLSSNSSLLSFEASLESPYATITGIEQQPVLNGTNDRIITITAEDGTVRTITVHVIKEREDEARLESLSVNNYSFDQEFNSDVYEYSMTVGYDKKILSPSDIVAIPKDENATVTMMSALTLSTSSVNRYNIKVTAADGFTEQNYVINITRQKGADATLKELSFANGILNSEFDSNNFEYIVYLPKNTTEIFASSVTALPSDSEATVSKLEYLELTNGDDYYTITVTSGNEEVTNTYRILIEYQDDTDSRLGSLEVSVGELNPSFNPNRYEYTLQLNSIQDRVTFDATTFSEYATILSGLGEVMVNKLSIDHIITVQAEDGSISEYIIHINRSSGTDANLKSLSVGPYALATTFDPYTYDYIIRVPKGTSILEQSLITAEPNDPYATVTMDSDLTITGNGSVFNIYVTSSNGEVTETYTLTTNFIYSSDATLSSITSSVGTLDPIFESSIKEYTIAVRDTQNSIDISATVNEENATIISGVGTHELPLEENIIQIMVEAEDGTIGIYKINVVKSITTERYLENIVINGLESDDCDPLLHWCELSDEFDSTITQYSVIVPPSIEVLSMTVTKKSQYQQVIYTNALTGEEFDPNGFILEYGRNTFDVTVINGVGDETTYRYNIERKVSENANLSSLGLTTADGNNTAISITPTFNPDVVEYNAVVENEHINLNVIATTEDQDANVRIYGNTDLWEGNNDIVVEVTAKSGNIKQYIIHVYRNKAHNNYLQSLTVSTGSIQTLDPVFDRSTYSYTVNVPSTVTQVTVDAVAELTTTTVTGTGEYELQPGLNIITITTKSAPTQSSEGITATYVVNVIKSISDNVNLSNIIVRNGTLLPEFSSDVMSYKVFVDNTVDSLDMSVYVENPNSTYRISGNQNFVTGVNNVTVTVISENQKRRRTYVIEVTKDGSHNNFLSDLQIDGDTITGFNKNDIEYDITVDSAVESINIEGFKEDPLSTVMGNGLYAIDYGTNTIPITVISEMGDVKVYTVNVTRTYNNNLIDLVVDEGTLTPAFNSNITNYTVSVDSDIELINIIGLKEASTATVSGNGTHYLDKGSNVILITVTSPDGSNKTYSITVNRAYEDDSTLSQLVVPEGILTPEFNSSTLEYSVNIPIEVESLAIQAIPTVDTSLITILDNENFEVGVTKQVIIKVDSELYQITNGQQGSTTSYIINVTKTEEELYSSKLSNITVTKDGVEQPLTPSFDTNTFYYEVEVETDVEVVTLDAVALDTERMVTITGVGEITLAFGDNIIPIVVTNEAGNSHTYTVNIHRKLSSDATIKSLSFNEGVLNETFEPNKLNYTMYLSPLIDTVNPIVEMNNISSRYTISGNTSLVAGENTLTITTLAPDRVTTLTYTITINKGYNDENDLLTLNSSVGEFDRTFTSNDQGPYVITVPSGTNSVSLSGTASLNATIVGLGVVNLNVNTADTNHTITVTSESGISKTYEVIIRKLPSSDSSLKLLQVSEGALTPVFESNVFNYTVTVPYETESLIVTAIANDLNATVTGKGIINLDVGTNTVEVVVTAQDNSQSTYQIIITRLEENVEGSTLLKDLIIYNGEIEPIFMPESFAYAVTIQGEVTSLDMDIQTKDPNATYEVSGNENLRIGPNIVTITVTGINGDTSVYTLSVNKQILSNNYLNELYTDLGELNPEFDKSTLNYTLTVPPGSEYIVVFATANDSLATVSGTGRYTLVTGDNIIKVDVTSATGIVRTYTITVTREESDENKLISLQSNIGNFTPLFEQNINEYTLNVPAETTQVVLSGEASVGATITGLGTVDITTGTTVHNINVTSESGLVNTYTINIVRPMSTNVTVTDIIPSNGELVPNFESSIKTYDLTLNGSNDTVSFEVITESPLATVLGNTDISLDYGLTEVVIEIIAEDGITKDEYTINVYKTKDLIDIIVPEEIKLSPNETYQINVEYVPIDPTQQDVTYSVLGPNIITVDENGLITSNGNLGISTVVVQSVDFPEITKTIRVTVEISEITSEIYEIYRELEDYDDYVTKIEVGLTVDEFKNNFDNDRELLHVYNSAGEEVEDVDNVATGMTIKLENNGTVYDELKIVVLGDVNGDGKSNALDYRIINNYILKKADLTDVTFLAGDVNGDNKVNALDYRIVNNYILRKITSYY